MMYSEILKVWNNETPDDFAIFSELYYEMFGGEEDIPYETSSTCSSFFPYDQGQLTRWHSDPSILADPVPIMTSVQTNHTNSMRKIESQMCAAIKADKNWSSGNTQVVTNDGVSTVYLHGNKIAMVDDTTMTIFDGGWQSNTTKSRLNALCSEFCIAGEGVFQKDFLWYVRKFVGCVNGQNVYQTEDFESGYVFA